MVDAPSRWIEVQISIVSSKSSAVTIQKLRETFAVHGLPEVLVSDNGTTFTPREFQEFLRQNGVKNLHTAPYHPASNGVAKRAVQTVNNGLKKINGSLEL